MCIRDRSKDAIERGHLVDIVRKVPPTPDNKYNFDKNPLKLTGQIGVPMIVDKLLVFHILKHYDYAYVHMTSIFFLLFLILYEQINLISQNARKMFFFIRESGLDGKENSNTLLFELKRNYTGTHQTFVN